MAPSRKIDASAAVVYEAEQFVSDILHMADRHGIRTHIEFGSTLILPVEQTFGSIESIQRYVDDVIARRDVKLISDTPAEVPYNITVKQGKWQDRSYAHAIEGNGKGTIGIGYDQSFYREIPILHEVAHLLGGSGHGQRFRAAYIKLLSTVMTPEMGFLMQIHIDRVHNERKDS